MESVSLGAGIALAGLFISGASLLIFTFKAYLSHGNSDSYVKEEIFRAEIENLKQLTERQNKELTSHWKRIEQYLSKINDSFATHEKRISRIEAKVLDNGE